MSESNQTFRGKIAPEQQGTELDFNISDVTNPGSEKTLLSHTVETGFFLNLLKIFLTTRTSGKFKLLVESTIIASGRTAPGNINVEFNWIPKKEASEGETITLKYEQVAGFPVSDIEAYLQTRKVIK